MEWFEAIAQANYSAVSSLRHYVLTITCGTYQDGDAGLRFGDYQQSDPELRFRAIEFADDQATREAHGDYIAQLIFEDDAECMHIFSLPSVGGVHFEHTDADGQTLRSGMVDEAQAEHMHTSLLARIPEDPQKWIKPGVEHVTIL